ncbi:glycosyltransferase family 1 protein [Flavobacterium crocinum]|uniref:Glycosyltransferase family 1 protein n=1 Tax=Flavobacterium crocinum TaxID=2183896 RepID=A0A2S1YFY7_9FLAO|nr:glycosyltransferase family 4 protein [Flavobacterium crocinum]AWK02974.1 glycosyltransferase family 1 protein [Flavobacterium crocinum]
MNTNLHVGYIVSHYPHKAFGHDGGIGTSVYTLVEKLRKSNVQVSVFVYGQKESFVIEEENVTLYSLENRKGNFFNFYFNRKKIEKFINGIIADKKIDIIEAPDWTGITAFMYFLVPLIIRFHGSDAYFCYLDNRKQKLKNFWFESLAIKGAEAFIAPTKFAGDVSKKLFKIKNKEIKTIHYGLDLKNFENETPEIFEKDLILYAGTLIRKKGVLELPEIFSKVKNDFPNAKLVLIGGDSSDIKTGSKSTWELMKTLFSKDNLKDVNYLGRIPYNEIQNYIKKANVCVFPTFAETLGMVTIESMAMKKSVVNSDIGWSKELILDKKNGFLVHPSNHDLYAERIKQILDNNVLAENIGKSAREYVEEKFDINKLVLENINFYQNILNQKK